MFLQEELAFSLKLRKIRLRRPQTSYVYLRSLHLNKMLIQLFYRWSAVVQGAVLYGMEIANHKNCTQMIPSPRSYGFVANQTFSKRMHDTRDIFTNQFTNKIMARRQFEWFVLKGDLLLENENRETEKTLTWDFQENDQKICNVCLFEYLDDNLPDRYETAQEGSFCSFLSREKC
jgi:hypothetical protein